MKMKALLIPVTLLSLVSCGGGLEGEEVTDLNNRVVKVKPGTYSKVVCIGAGALRLYSYIGDVDKLGGVEDIDNLSLSDRPKMFDNAARPYVIKNKEVFKTLPSCGVGGPQAQAAEAEKILNCNPDIVISLYEDVDKANSLQTQLGVPVLTLSYGPKGVFDNRFASSISLLGKVFNKEEKASTLLTYINSQKEEIFNRTSSVVTSEKAYICGLGNWGTTNQYMTAQNYEPFNIAHINNVVNDLTNNGIQAIEKEKFVSLASQIDMMFVDAAAVKNIKPLTQDSKETLEFATAWNNDNVYLQMAYNAYYTNCEIALANTWWGAKCMYPSLFDDINIKDKLNEVTKVFLDEELADEIYNCPLSFGGYQKINVEEFFN